MSRKEYFAYGSNLNFDQMVYRCPEATVVGIAKLNGYELAFRADQPQPQQKGAEGERRVIPDGRFPELRVLLVDALRRDCHSQNDVCFGFTRMERGIEQAPFDCTVIEYRMHIEGIMLSST